MPNTFELMGVYDCSPFCESVFTLLYSTKDVQQLFRDATIHGGSQTHAETL